MVKSSIGGGSVKILIVDDEKFNLVMARDIIEAHVENQEILLCQSPEQVMELLAQQDIGIVLLDIMMPKVNGIEILKDIRRKDEYNDIQIIMFTGVADKESFRLCFENGANDFISKPINVIEFTARMRAAVKARKNVLMLRNMFNKTAEQYNELQQANRSMKSMQEQLIQQEKLASLGEMAAGVAHEINNPIGFVSSNLETMGKYLAKIKEILALYRNFSLMAGAETVGRQELLQAKQRLEETEEKQKMDMILADIGPIIEESKDGVNRVTKIVRSLRNFARTGLEDEMAMSDLNQIIEEALLIVRNEVKYAANVEKKLGTIPNILCDKGQIGQVLVNIFVNAAQAIKSQKRNELGTIFVETCTDDIYVVGKITDDGPGIPPEYLGRIFDPFFTTKEVGGGTGLGLSIAYGIIKKHGGELLAESEAGKGASFTIKIPYRDKALQ
ncbi:MAG: response regulator [Veillonellales bacterium]